MKMNVRRIWVAAAAVLGMAACAGTASAGPIAFTFTLSPVDVSVYGETFDDAALTFTLDADTDDIQEDQGNYILTGTTRFTIAGGPSGPAGTFTLGLFSPMGSLVVESPQFKFATEAPSLAGYDLASAIAGTSPRAILTGDAVLTQIGYLLVTPGSSGLVALTFSAGVGAVPRAVPEPSSLALAALAALVPAGLWLRRRGPD